MVVYDFSFGFLKTWKGVKVPRRFISDAKSVSTEYTDPLISQLIQEDYASLRELEEYYSLEDAFRMFDIMTAKESTPRINMSKPNVSQNQSLDS